MKYLFYIMSMVVITACVTTNEEYEERISALESEVEDLRSQVGFLEHENFITSDEVNSLDYRVYELEEAMEDVEGRVGDVEYDILWLD
ncbi:MAG: hypothetical protein J6C56_04760 [Alistipes sp.]|nr:hypothetical protein [Alistipes sp.]